MAIHGVGSFDEPILVSDEEDAAYVENELSRWNDSPCSSVYEYPAARDTITRQTKHNSSVSAKPRYSSTAYMNQKCERQDSEPIGFGPSSPYEKLSKRARKQNMREEIDRYPGVSKTVSPSSKIHRSFDRPSMSGWSRGDHLYASPSMPSTVIARLPQAQPLGFLEAAGVRESWPVDLSHRGDHGSVIPYRDPPRSQSTMTFTSAREVAATNDPFNGYVSWSERPPRPVSSTIDVSLRRLEALSASLFAMSAKTPSPLTIGKGHVQPSAKFVYDKRRMGMHEDKGNIGSFDVSNLTLQPSSTSDLPPPQLSRTIVLAHLPKKFRVRTFVNTWARRFGTVHRIEVDAKLGKALVEYANPSEAQAAFASSRLRGEGKEHIRVYWYQGPAMKSSASTSPSGHPDDVEEGEIEEGEVVESPVASVKPKKKQKAKKKKSETVHQCSPSASNATTTALSSASTSAPVVDDVPHTAVPLPRPPLEERLSDVPAALKGVWEEEMELDSDCDYRNEQSLSPALLATTIESSPDDMDLEEWEADMDVEESSPAQELNTSLPLAVLQNDAAAESSGSALKRPRSPSLTPDVRSRSGPAVASVEDRRLHLQLEIEQQKISAVLASSTSTAESPSGVPTTPEPATPSDWSVNARMSVTPSDSELSVEGRHAVALPLPSEDNKPVPDLDKLAESFICESIQAVAAPVVPCKASSAASTIPVLSRPRINRSVPPVSPSTSSLPRRISSSVPHALAISSLLPALSSHVSSMSSAVPASEAVQLLAKKKRLEEYIAMTKNLLAKISAAKSKAEKDSLMRILKEKQRVMDLELQEGTASPSTPGARVINAMPAPTSMAKLFRWPDTPRELIIEISDDEADDMLSNTPSAVGKSTIIPV